MLWLLVWQVAAWAVGNRILLAGPIEAALALCRGILTPAFWAAIGFSFVRIAGGFALAFALALACGTAAWRFKLFGEVLRPLVTFMKSVPVVCIIVLLLVWTGSANVSIIAVALMVFPPVYFSYLEGLRQTDDDLRQMLAVFNVRTSWRIRYYYVPAVMPYVISAARVVVGIAWKSGVAAEVIGIPAGSIGAGIYYAKIGLSTADLFAWTFAIVGLSALSEKLFLMLLSRLESMGATLPAPSSQPGQANQQKAASPEPPAPHHGAIGFDGATFRHGDTLAVSNFTCAIEPGGRYCLMGPSGSGKTTLLDALCGFTDPVAGTVQRPAATSRDFQEDRLIAQLSAWGNVALCCPGLAPAERDLMKFDLDEMLGRDSANLMPDACSGGMKRKVALMRALSAPGDALLLDEPFAGLDDVSRADAVALINRHLHGRTLIVTTHDADDVAFLNATRILM